MIYTTKINNLARGCERGFDGTVPHRLISGGGQRHSRQNLIHLAVVFAALLTLTSGPASADNECGTATGTPPTVTCPPSSGSIKAGVRANNAEIKYVVNHNTKGLKLTVDEGVDLDGDFFSGLWVFTQGVLTDNGKIEVISSGNYSAVVNGIHVQLDEQPSVPVNEVPIILNIPKGVFTMKGTTNGAAVKVDARDNSKDITINFNGQVNGLSENKNGIGISDTSKEGGSVYVTLQGETQIGGDIGHGVDIRSEGSETAYEEVVSLDIEAGARIGTEDKPVKKDGVFVMIEGAGKSTVRDINVRHAGQLHADGHGIWVDHRWSDYKLGGLTEDQHKALNEGRTYAVYLQEVKNVYDGGRSGKVAITVAAGGLLVAGEDKDGIFISTHQYGHKRPKDLDHQLTAKKVKPRTFVDSAEEDGARIAEKAAVAGMYHQRVIVDGEIRGGKNGAAVHLMGGGTVTLGAKGKLVPHAEGTTSRSVKVSEAANKANTPDLLILLDGNFRGIQKIESVTDRTGSTTDKTRFRYRLLGGETTYTDLKNGGEITLALAEPSGFYNDWQRQVKLTASITEPVNDVFSLSFTPNLATKLTAPTGPRQVSQRGKVYQSLPSVLWDLSGGMDRYVPAAPAASVEQDGEAMQFSADGAGGGNAGWVRVEGSSGDRRLKKSLGEAVSYRLSSTGFAVGADLPGDGGLSYRAGLHHRQGRAKVTGGGQVEASGIGAGFGVAKRQANGWVLDGWLGVTQYDDIKVKSSDTIAGQATPFTVNAKTKGTSYALGIGAAMELALGDATVTQRGSLAWTSVSMKDFKTAYMNQKSADSDKDGNTFNTITRATTALNETVAMKDGSGLQGGYGVRIDTQYGTGDCCGLFGSLDLMHDFNAKRSVSVSSDLRSDTVSTESRPTSVRLGAGGSRSWNEGRSTLSGAIYYTTAGSGNSSLSGGVALAFRF